MWSQALMFQPTLVLMLMISLGSSSTCDIFTFLRLSRFAVQWFVAVSWWATVNLVSSHSFFNVSVFRMGNSTSTTTARSSPACVQYVQVNIQVLPVLCSYFISEMIHLFWCILVLIWSLVFDLALQEMVTQNCVVIFSKSTCPFCKMAKNVFNEIGANYKVIELDEHNDGRQLQEVLAHMTGARTVRALCSPRFRDKTGLRTNKIIQFYCCLNIQNHTYRIANTEIKNITVRLKILSSVEGLKTFFVTIKLQIWLPFWLCVQVPRVFVNGNCIGGGSDTKRLHQEGKLRPLIEQCTPCCAASSPEGSGSGQFPSSKWLTVLLVSVNCVFIQHCLELLLQVLCCLNRLGWYLSKCIRYLIQDGTFAVLIRNVCWYFIKAGTF